MVQLDNSGQSILDATEKYFLSPYHEEMFFCRMLQMNPYKTVAASHLQNHLAESYAYSRTYSPTTYSYEYLFFVVSLVH